MNLRLLKVAPILMLFSVFFTQDNQYLLASLCIIATFSTLQIFRLADYSIYRLSNIFFLYTFISFPVAIFFNCLLEIPVVRSDLWGDSYNAIIAYIIGSIFFIFGLLAFKIKKGSFNRMNSFINALPPIRTNILITLIHVPIVFLHLYLGTYFHSSITDFNFTNASYLNVLNYFFAIANLGLIFQTYRYISTESKLDLVVMLILLLFSVFIYLPSGSRIFFMSIVFTFIITFSFKNNFDKKDGFLLAFILLTSILLINYSDLYRNISDLKLVSKSSVISEIENQASEREITTGLVILSRMSDFTAAGRLISDTPEKFPYRYFAGVLDWWQILIPGFLRPSDKILNLNDGAELTYKYNVSTTESSSSPVTIFGDLFTRFGWIGICLGFFSFAIILASIDDKLNKISPLERLIFLGFYSITILRSFESSLLVIFTAFTRDLFIFYLLSIFSIKFFLRVKRL